MSDDFIGRELLGQFRVLERIGIGGMGAVYKAEQPAMDRMVAVKILHPKLAERKDLVSRFRREARAMSRLTHPNTVRVFLYGQLEEGSLYIVMEYLEGENLYKLNRREGPFSVERTSAIMVQVLGALEEAHTLGIIHRDLKPENILLTEQGGIKDFPKVLDFGLAKIKEAKLRPGSMVLTVEGMVFGTPEFMSPEQASGETLDARSDIYSLGIIFYEMVTGQLPFNAKKPNEFIVHHIKSNPIPVTQRVPGQKIDPRLEPILGRALEKKRSDRYQTAKEFATALTPLMKNPGLIASPIRSVPKISERHLSVQQTPAPVSQQASPAQPDASPSEKPVQHAADTPDLSSKTGDTVELKRSYLIGGMAIGIIVIILLIAALLLSISSCSGEKELPVKEGSLSSQLLTEKNSNEK